ncbi:MAG: hypothetical protein PW789_08750 [Edaphobacter sp.]|uniref:hypothetical protein n=1 Tax=Edaphobacter sp. TaxID=1934404 RepID=UPI0023870C16|nr:hypothetical protein [Edaphobacter sp.]MDE1176684.1 hypothetical protein [Edaphobacter sp.]
MQVLLKHSEEKKDIECAVCKQGFLVYWERSCPNERETMRTIVLGELARHHHDTDTTTAHPAMPFNMPDWSGDHRFSGAALLGGLSGLRREIPIPRA